ncbi:MAG TPA: NAD(P)H-hydrate dehydratase [Eggerthellaceae bacterium]|nr:NAD(P)H-hydrate dehydratase [Eggerthellaceae bacterium]
MLQLKDAWTEDELRNSMPHVVADENKYTRGVLTIIAGSKRYPGAACLAAHAAQRMGAGYTEVVAGRRTAGIILARHPSIVVHDMKRWQPKHLAKHAQRERHAVCIGPGFPADSETVTRMVQAVLNEAKGPVLVDGGALSALSSKGALRALATRREQGLATVITPHMGEAARLRDSLIIRSGTPAQVASAIAMATGAIVVLKGPDTFIAAENKVFPMCEGTPALAKAGSGDVLAGMMSALLALGTQPVAAAVLGATLHARAGIAAAQDYTELGVTPEDVIARVPAAIRTLA